MSERTPLTEVFENVDLTWGPQLALVIFAVFMLGVFVWVLRPRASGTYSALGRRPLEKEG